jgi:steroid 5-alpha reductase family enzyme
MSGAQLVFVIVALALALSLVMSCAWAIERRTGNSGWIDTVWTFGLGAVGIAFALVPFGLGPVANGPRRILVAVAALVWALRLGVHIANRTAGIADDPRYAALRRGFGARASWQMWLLVQKQALASIPLALAMVLAADNPAPDLRLQDYVAGLIFIIAIAGEAVADGQLRRFRNASSGHAGVCDVGLWRWSRHPNYFFEWFGWLAYPLIAIGPHYPLGWIALAGPACMYGLLVYVSGIPPLEAHMLQTRGEAFRAYQARTNAFFPWPPRERTKTALP